MLGVVEENEKWQKLEFAVDKLHIKFVFFYLFAHGLHCSYALFRVFAVGFFISLGGDTDYGLCGRECCCASCMPDIKKVSIKMAKNQGLSLNPVKISGLCGRLMCCLGYENDYYADACKLWKVDESSFTSSRKSTRWGDE